MTIRTIEHDSAEYEQMIKLRLRVLLNPIHVPLSYINQDQERNDVLVGAFEEEELIGCCVLTEVDKETVQLRQMAVDTGLQGKGVGASLLAYSEKLARNKGYTTLMMHARDAVLPFYEKCGYAVSGAQFFEVGIPHYKMQKPL